MTSTGIHPERHDPDHSPRELRGASFAGWRPRIFMLGAGQAGAERAVVLRRHLGSGLNVDHDIRRAVAEIRPSAIERGRSANGSFR